MKPTPVLRYGPRYSSDPAGAAAAATKADRTSKSAPAGGKANEIVTWAVLAICLAGWTVVGFVLWIPRVLRGVLLFSGAMVQSTVQETGPTSAGRRLRSAANFYKRGYVGAIAAVRSALDQQEDEDDDGSNGGWKLDSQMITREAAWSLAVWYVLLWPLVIQGSPLDPVTPLVEASWSQVWWEIVRVFTSFPDLFSR